jgi:hypothetical protein
MHYVYLWIQSLYSAHEIKEKTPPIYGRMRSMRSLVIRKRSPNHQYLLLVCLWKLVEGILQICVTVVLVDSVRTAVNRIVNMHKTCIHPSLPCKVQWRPVCMPLWFILNVWHYILYNNFFKDNNSVHYRVYTLSIMITFSLYSQRPLSL